jgi:hypothetical protein
MGGMTDRWTEAGSEAASLPRIRPVGAVAVARGSAGTLRAS